MTNSYNVLKFDMQFGICIELLFSLKTIDNISNLIDLHNGCKEPLIGVCTKIKYISDDKSDEPLILSQKGISNDVTFENA